MKRALLMIAGSMFLFGCNEKLSKVSPSDDVGTLSCTSLDFATVESRVLTPTCVKCHSWSSDFASVNGKVTKIKELVSNGSMPKKGVLTSNQKDTLLKWLDCGASEQKPTSPTSPTSPTPPVTPTPPVACDSVPDFAAVEERVLKPACIECHKGMTDFAKTQKQAKEIDDEIRTNRMPKDRPPLSAEQREAILKWVECGTPETNPTPAPPQQPAPPAPVDPTPVTPPPATPGLGAATYVNIRVKILEPKCLKCHVSGGHAELYDFTTYKDMKGLDIFDLGHPDNSDIIKDVTAVGKDQMPPQKSGIAHLTTEEIALLREWIQLGLPEK